jgi:hypothetical protein
MASSNERNDPGASRPQQDEGSAPSVSATMEQAQKSASAAADRMKNRARDMARDMAEQQKAAGADQLGGMAHAMEAAAGELQKQMPLAAEYVDDVAARLDDLASALRERSVDDMLGNVADFARRQPAAFFAGAVAAGFALSRFAKSSANRKG